MFNFLIYSWLYYIVYSINFQIRIFTVKIVIPRSCLQSSNLTLTILLDHILGHVTSCISGWCLPKLRWPLGFRNNALYVPKIS